VQKKCEKKIIKIEVLLEQKKSRRERSLLRYGVSLVIIRDVFELWNFLSVITASIYFFQTDAQTFFDTKWRRIAGCWITATRQARRSIRLRYYIFHEIHHNTPT